MKQKTRAWLGASVAGKLATAAQADYPAHPIDMVIPFGAAGAMDSSTRPGPRFSTPSSEYPTRVNADEDYTDG